MNANSALPVLLAVACVAATGVAATTLESSLETDPDDVIDIDVRRLPVGGDAVAAIKHEMESNERNDGSATRPRPTASDRVAEARERVAKRSASLARSTTGRGTPFADRFPWIWIGLAAGLAALGYRYRDRVLAWLPSRVAPDGSDGGRWPPGEPATELGRAWLAVVRRADPDRPGSKTVAECTSIAVDRGMDPEALDAIARTFEEVRYGDASLTDARRRLVRRGRRRLGIDSEGNG